MNSMSGVEVIKKKKVMMTTNNIKAVMITRAVKL